MEPVTPEDYEQLRRYALGCEADYTNLLARYTALEDALRGLIQWLDDDTLEIMKDTIKMGITFDWSDCQSLLEQIDKARKALNQYSEESR